MWVFGPVGHLQTVFWSNLPLNFIPNIQQIWVHLPIMRYKSVHILRIRRLNLFVYWEYVDGICTYTEITRNKVDLQTEFRCASLLNTWNESVRKLRICTINLYVNWEYAECMKSRIPWRIPNQIENILGRLSAAQMGSIGQTTLNQTITCKCTFRLNS
jgi:hypothetical protein